MNAPAPSLVSSCRHHAAFQYHYNARENFQFTLRGVAGPPKTAPQHHIPYTIYRERSVHTLPLITEGFHRKQIPTPHFAKVVKPHACVQSSKVGGITRLFVLSPVSHFRVAHPHHRLTSVHARSREEGPMQGCGSESTRDRRWQASPQCRHRVPPAGSR